MGKPTGFMEFQRQAPSYAPAHSRIRHYNEFMIPLEERDLQRQGSRCMDCGTPYCHMGCPVDNIIPDWNHMIYRNQWRDGLNLLHSTNNFPEFTGRVCPAPCEASCTLNLDDVPVTIKSIELAMVERGWNEGWIQPLIPAEKTGKRVAVIGSGPAGLAASQQLARAGHAVVQFEKNARFGGLLRYGIPDFKLEKRFIDRRISQMQAEGVEFLPNTEVGVNYDVERLMAQYDAVILACGSEKPRDLPVPGRELDGVHYAMDFLTQQNRRNGGEPTITNKPISAAGKDVVVIGGGDTGSDCVGTSVRQGAATVMQIEIMPKPPKVEDKMLTWPAWPNRLRTSTSHEEGCDRDWDIMTTEFLGENGKLKSLRTIKVEWVADDQGRMSPREIPGTEKMIEAQLVLLAMGFVHPVHEGLMDALGVDYDERGNIKADTVGYRTSVDKVFAAGDTRRGQSLVVWAIREGRQAARAVDEFLMGSSTLPR